MWYPEHREPRRERYIHHLGHFVGKVIHCSKQCWRISIEGAPSDMAWMRFRSRRTAQAYAMKWLQVNHKVKFSQASISMDPFHFTSDNAKLIAGALNAKMRT